MTGTYMERLVNIIQKLTLNEGSNLKKVSYQKICKRMFEDYKIKNTKYIKKTLEKGVNEDIFVKIKFSFKLSSKMKNKIKNGEKYFSPGQRNKMTNTLFYKACKKGDIKTVRKLISTEGVNINKEHSFGLTPLISATKNNQLEIVRILLDHGVDTEKSRHDKAIVIACKKRFIDIVSLLLDRGVDIETRDNIGNTILMASILKRRNEGVVKLLLERGACVNSRNYFNHDTPLLLSCQYSSLRLINVLLDKGSDIHCTNSNGENCLMKAVDGTKITLIKMFLGMDIDLEAKDKTGCTSLMRSVKKRNGKMVKFLLEKGANIETKDNIGNTPLILSTIREFGRDYGITKMMIDYGANVDAVNDEGHSFLDHIFYEKAKKELKKYIEDSRCFIKPARD